MIAIIADKRPSRSPPKRVSLVVLTIIFGWLVFGRKVRNATPTWAEQMALLLVMAIAFLGAAVSVHDHSHFAVTAFRTSLRQWLRTVFLVATDLLLAGFGPLMMIYGARLTIFKWGAEIPLIEILEGLRSLQRTIGGTLVLLFSSGHLTRLVQRRDRRRDSIEE